MSIRTSAMLASLLLLGACATPPAPPQPGVTMLNATRLQTLIETSPIQLATTETGTLRAALTIRNRSMSRLLIEGRATFSAESGAAPENPSGWQHVFIERDSAASLQFSSLGNRARSVTIELREAVQ